MGRLRRIIAEKNDEGLMLLDDWDEWERTYSMYCIVSRLRDRRFPESGIGQNNSNHLVTISEQGMATSNSKDLASDTKRDEYVKRFGRLYLSYAIIWMCVIDHRERFVAVEGKFITG